MLALVFADGAAANKAKFNQIRFSRTTCGHGEMKQQNMIPSCKFVTQQ